MKGAKAPSVYCGQFGVRQLAAAFVTTLQLCRKRQQAAALQIGRMQSHRLYIRRNGRAFSSHAAIGGGLPKCELAIAETGAF
jgi:hypothetical protein